MMSFTDPRAHHLAELAGWQGSGVLPSLLLQHGVTDVHPNFQVGAEDPKSVPLACTDATLLTVQKWLHLPSHLPSFLPL